MAVYQAPEIKDRIAVGDDMYLIEPQPDGRDQLTPDPDEVTEAGTPINKALLQPMADAIERIDLSMIPYAEYWWKRRPTASSWTESRVDARNVSGSYNYHSSTQNGAYYYITFSPTDVTKTIQVASAITINQSTGAVSLKNPTSYSYTEDTFDASTYKNLCAGKYVKGLYPLTTQIFFVPAGLSVVSRSWYSSDGTEQTDEVGYELNIQNGNTSGGLPLAVQSVKNTTIGSWEAVSSPDPDAYPKSGTSDGYEWRYYGTIADAAISPPGDGWTTTNVTSASFSGSNCDIAIPADMALVALNGTTGTTACKKGYAFGVVDTKNGKYYGYAINGVSSSSNYYAEAICGSATIATLYYSGTDAYCKATAQSGGIRLTSTGLSGFTGTVCYMPLDR